MLQFSGDVKRLEHSKSSAVYILLCDLESHKQLWFEDLEVARFLVLWAHSPIAHSEFLVQARESGF